MRDLGQTDYLRDLMQKLDTAQHGTRGAIVRSACGLLACSQAELYRRLAEVGWSSGRKQRSDKGRTSVDDGEAQTIGALLMNSVRANGKRTMSIRTAAEIAQANGLLTADVTPSTLGRVLRQKGMHPDQAGIDSPHVTMRSLHPNHVWQIDASVCVLYYLDNRGLSVASEREFYKNKPGNLKRIEKARVIRYVAVDHYSGALYVEYFHGAEDTENLYRFWASAITQRTEPGDPFHGVPHTLMLDRGSASEGHMFSNLLQRLQVEHLTHLPGNPRAKGSVERSHDIVEREFESRLGVGARVADLAELNAMAHRWMRWFNASRIHTRHGHSRYGLWQTIRPEQLRIAPPRDLLDSLLTTKPVEVKVGRGLTIRHAPRGSGSLTYSVADLPEVRVGDLLTVCVNPYRAPNVHVLSRDRDGRELHIELQPLERDAAGFVATAPVIGQQIHTHADTVPDTQRKAMLKAAYGVETMRDAEAARKARKPAFEGRIDPMADVAQAQTLSYMQRRGVELPIEAPRVEATPLTHVQAAKRLREAGIEMSRERFAALASDYPDGISEEALTGLLARWPVATVAPATVALEEVPRLSVVGKAG